ncbi:hypothetical protein P261_02549 [Lachnospiraceae bacterium TWA4]|nr:hypothetical protein P261_02549 [Lachnospiraceae bacterium TWA4]
MFLTSLETKQERYQKQVEIPFVKDQQKEEIFNRLATVFTQGEHVQIGCKLPFRGKTGRREFVAVGFADVVKDRTVYELKFVNELTHEHFLQCACYMIALKYEKGILWNVRTNQMYELRVFNRKLFMKKALKTITKHTYRHSELIAVIDTETNWNDEVMSVGLVIADSITYEPVKKLYYIFPREAKVGGMYSYVLKTKTRCAVKECERSEAMLEICQLLKDSSVKKLFAYNAMFDKKHLLELKNYDWYDIMRIAAYKQYNVKISDRYKVCKTGRLKSNYGVEPIMRMLSGNQGYIEPHNAIADALDELKIMKLLGNAIGIYENAKI